MREEQNKTKTEPEANCYHFHHGLSCSFSSTDLRAVPRAMLGASHAATAGGPVRAGLCWSSVPCDDGREPARRQRWESFCGQHRARLLAAKYYKQLAPATLQMNCILPSLMSIGKKPIYTRDSEQGFFAFQTACVGGCKLGANMFFFR